MPRQIVPLVARSPQGRRIEFPSISIAAKQTTISRATIHHAIVTLRPTQHGWSFKRAEDYRPFKEHTFMTQGRAQSIVDEEGRCYPSMRAAAREKSVPNCVIREKVRQGEYKKAYEYYSNTAIEDENGILYPSSQIAALLLGIDHSVVCERIAYGIYKHRLDIDLTCKE